MQPCVVFFINMMYLVTNSSKIWEKYCVSFLLANMKLHIFGINGGKDVKIKIQWSITQL